MDLGGMLLGQVLGTPSREDIHSMNPNYTEFKFPQIKPHPWSKVFSKRLPADAIDLVRSAPFRVQGRALGLIALLCKIVFPHPWFEVLF
jgi:hypothetical protein